MVRRLRPLRRLVIPPNVLAVRIVILIQINVLRVHPVIVIMQILM